MGEKIQAAWEIIYNNIIPIVLFCSIFIEIVPVKFSPLTALVTWLFKPVRDEIEALKKEMTENIDSMKSELKEDIDNLVAKDDDISEQLEAITVNQDKRRFATIRWEVLEFANSIENGALHTHFEYQHIKDDIEEYKALHEKYPDLTNGYLEEAIVDINKHYDEHKTQNLKYF